MNNDTYTCDETHLELPSTSTRPHLRRGVRVSAWVLSAVASFLFACTAPGHVEADTPVDDAAGEDNDGSAEGTGIRFTRADLVDVATYVSDRTGTGFVLAEPELRTLTLSLYMPNDVTSAQAEDMFLTALESLQIKVFEKDGYWLVTRRGTSHIDEMLDGERGTEGADVTFDFRETRLDEVTAFLSAISGERVLIHAEVPKHRVTVQSLTPVTRAEAIDVLLQAIEAQAIEVEQDGDVIVLKHRSRAAAAVRGPDGGDDDTPR